MRARRLSFALLASTACSTHSETGLPPLPPGHALVAPPEEPGAADVEAPETCESLRADYASALGRLGPRHPRMIHLTTAVASCPLPSAPPPPDAEECSRLHALRLELADAGKGENHPRVLANEARLASCW